MSLYFVRHMHDAKTCPAKDPDMGQRLVQHVSKSNAREFGVNLLSDTVLDGQHTFVMSWKPSIRPASKNLRFHSRWLVRWRSYPHPPAKWWWIVKAANPSRLLNPNKKWSADSRAAVSSAPACPAILHRRAAARHEWWTDSPGWRTSSQCPSGGTGAPSG